MIGDRPILIFGLPRSGTSWIARIFDSHPDTLYRHEPDRRIRDSGLPAAPTADDIERAQATARAYIESRLARSRERTAGSPPYFAKNYRSPAAARARVAMIYAMKGISRLAPGLADTVPIPDLIAGNARARVRRVWKSVVATTHLPAYARLVPEARCLLVVRHPGGKIASTARGRSEGHLPGRAAPPAIAQRWVLEPIADGAVGRRAGIGYDDVRRAEPGEQEAFSWALLNQWAVDGIEGLPNCRLVRYEDVAMDPEARARELFAFAGLDWNDQSETFIRASSRAAGGDATRFFSLYRDSRQSAGKWRQALTPEQIARIAAVVMRFPVGRLYAESFAPRP